MKERESLKSRLEAIVQEMVERGISFEDAREEFERHFIRAVLGQHNGNLSRAASELGIHRNTLSKRVKTAAPTENKRRAAKPKPKPRSKR